MLITVSICAFAVFMHSCKKTDKTENTIIQDDGTAAVIKATEARYGKVSTAVVYNVNKLADFIELDKNGNELGIRQSNANARPGGPGCSSYDCALAESNALDISGFDERYLLYSVEVFSGCGTANGTQVKVTWDVSVPYTVLTASQSNSSLLSKGRIRFKNSSGTVLISYLNITPISITPLGINPTCSFDKDFRVTYTLNNVPDSYLGNSNTLECQLFTYTNCSLLPQKLTTWLQGVTLSASNTSALPCNRIDKLWINPSTGTAQSQCASVAGAYVTCPAPPANFVRTTSQQVEYRKRNVASYNWDDQTLATSPIYSGVLPPLATGAASSTVSSCCGVLYLKNMVQGVSTLGWLVRYKNVYTPSTGTTCPATTPLGATWTLGTYTTEYWIY